MHARLAYDDVDGSHFCCILFSISPEGFYFEQCLTGLSSLRDVSYETHCIEADKRFSSMPHASTGSPATL